MISTRENSQGRIPGRTPGVGYREGLRGWDTGEDSRGGVLGRTPRVGYRGGLQGWDTGEDSGGGVPGRTPGVGGRTLGVGYRGGHKWWSSDAHVTHWCSLPHSLPRCLLPCTAITTNELHTPNHYTYGVQISLLPLSVGFITSCLRGYVSIYILRLLVFNCFLIFSYRSYGVLIWEMLTRQRPYEVMIHPVSTDYRLITITLYSEYLLIRRNSFSKNMVD